MSQPGSPKLGRSMGVLLAGILVFHAGWYMLLPFFVLLFTARRGLTPAEAGSVLAVQSFALLLGSLLGGLLADRYGRRITMGTGLVLRAAGIGALGFTGSLPTTLGAAAIAGLGGGLYGPAAKAAIAMMASETDRTRAFSLRGIAANIGTSSGPLLGTVLVRMAMPVLFMASAALHMLLALVTWLMLPEEPALSRQVREDWRDMLRDLPFMLFSLITILAWALFTQLAIAVPLYASRVLGLEAMIGLVWTVTSLTVILFQVPVSRMIVGRLHPFVAMAGGATLLGLGLYLVGFARSFTGLIGAVLLFVVGEMLLMPTVDSTVSAMARPGLVGAYFGIATLVWGLGEGVGSLAGGALVQVTLPRGPLGLPWSAYLVTGILTGALFLALLLTPQRNRAKRPAPIIFRPGYPTADETVRLEPGEEAE